LTHRLDTLQLEGAGLTLDLTKISDRRIQDIEVIDMTGSGDKIYGISVGFAKDDIGFTCV
jgi:hypothetical protein